MGSGRKSAFKQALSRNHPPGPTRGVHHGHWVSRWAMTAVGQERRPLLRSVPCHFEN